MDMARQNYRRFCSESLMPLRMVLTNAGKDLPPRVVKLKKDVDEELALKLIEKMKTAYKKPLPFLIWKAEESRPAFVERLQEMAGKDAG